MSGDEVDVAKVKREEVRPGSEKAVEDVLVSDAAEAHPGVMHE